jgi:hypothetical protein
MGWTYEPEWDGLTAGDIVKLTGEQGEFKFKHAAIKDGELNCLMLIGGISGHSMWRCVAPDRIKRITKKAQATRRTK